MGLTASIDVLLTRAGNGVRRPLLAGGDRRARMATLLRERETKYAQASALIDTSDLTVDQAAEKIVQLLGLKKAHADSHRPA